METDIIDHIVSLMRGCGFDRDFVDKYVMNAVLSSIEEKEQKLIHSMRYNDWIVFDKDYSISRIIDFLNSMSVACNDRFLNDSEVEYLRKRIIESLFIEKCLCRLYIEGLYGDRISRYILLRKGDNPVNDKTINRCVGELIENKGDIMVRSRFIEIARDLYRLKQRFPDKTVWESNPLVDRVFAYVEPRRLPIGKHPASRMIDLIKDSVEKLIRNMSNYYGLQGIDLETISNRVMEILREFFSRFGNNFRFYDYQVKGINKILEKISRALLRKDEYNIPLDYAVIEAPTGSGKTEIFTLALIITALIRKTLLYEAGLYLHLEKMSPLGIIVYPRRALASNQVERLIKYLKLINEVIQRYYPFELTLSLNYTEVRYKKEYLNAVDECIREGKTQCDKKIKEYGVRVRIYTDKNEIEIKYFLCPDGSYPRLKYIFAVTDNRSDIRRMDIRKGLYCGDEHYSFIRAVKDDVKSSPGDIHLTVFETLRRNLLATTWSKIFSSRINDSMKVAPMILVLDEIHTYVGITGARHAFLLRRVLNRIWHDIDKRRGFVVVGVSATIPNKEEFLKELFQEKHMELRDVLISVSPKETIPLGNEYFYIVVPTHSYKVDNLSVTIQTVMDIFYNIPLYNTRNPDKKAFVFIDNLDVVYRAKHDLLDAVRRKEDDEEYGLQDLRNIYHKLFKDTTIPDYNDRETIVSKIISNEMPLTSITDLTSWRDGEVWWGYSLEYKKYGRFTEVESFTSSYKPDISRSHIIVTTSSLEVGVDYSDVVLIHQHGAPMNLSSLVQRAGRAGRIIRRNPLARTAISIQLSPENPLQSIYFEIFMRSRSLREALKYDRLWIPIENSYVVKQTIAEAVLDYMVYKKREIWIDNLEEFECKTYPSIIMKNSQDLIKYIKQIFPYVSHEKIRTSLEEIIGYLNEKCIQYGEI